MPPASASATYDIVFYHQFLARHPMWPSQSKAELELDPRLMVGMATDVAHRRAPMGQPVLITNDGAAFAGRPHLAIERRELADPATLQYDRTRCYRDYIAARVGRTDRLGAIFLDTDALVLRELAPLFDLPFDVALTYLESALEPAATMRDHWGLPNDGRQSAINFGVMAARFTPAAVAFFDAALSRFAAMAAEGTDFLAGPRNRFRTADRTAESYFQVDDVRTWGGGQFAMTSLLADALFDRLRPDSEVAGARVRLLPAESWNFSPGGGALGWDMLDGRHILHLKGNRKAQFTAIAAHLA
ncbi:hypothetical protein EDC65_2631 [Stella humosa]|uniref:Glycosyl transferase family 8 n=1 Tax=Stella humosa TaxID=94 RepID=A0A3N1LHD3_9PROT|nr:hypothetical protein [Stella humosa]ROP90772.1 hypothetical protein EDC65_2631 [Stella humosa]BBK34882.1 hypothetical protein STHU_55160 [Stella humosa]